MLEILKLTTKKVKICQGRFLKLEHFWVTVSDDSIEIGGKIPALGEVRDVDNKTRARHS